MSIKQSSKVATKKIGAHGDSKVAFHRTRREVLKRATGGMSVRIDPLVELSAKMRALGEQRALLPMPEETQIFGLWPERLDTDRRTALENLYTSNPTFRKFVDELRKNKAHYINQLTLG